MRFIAVLILAPAAGLLTAFVPWAGAFLGPLLLSLIGLKGLVGILFPKSNDPSFHRRLTFWTYVALACHLILGALITYTPRALYYFGPDAADYHNNAAQLVQHWSGSGSMPDLSEGKQGFAYLLAAVYWVFGPYQIGGLVINAALGAGILPLLTDVSRRLLGQPSMRYVAPLLILLPGFRVWPSQLLREAAVLFCIVLALHAAVTLRDAIKPRYVLLLSLSLTLLFTLRAPVSIVLSGTLVAALVIGHRRIAEGFASSILLSLLTIGMVVGAQLGYVGYQSAFQHSLDDLSRYQEESAAEETGFVQSEPVGSSPRSALLGLPLGLVRLLAGPFPWEIDQARQAPALIDSLSLWFLFPFVIMGLVEAKRRVGRGALLLLLPAAAMAVGLSLALGNYGVVMRERPQVLLFLIPIAALGLAARAERIATRRARQRIGFPIQQRTAVRGSI